MLCPVHFRHTEPTAVMPSFLHFPTPSEGVTLSLHFPTPSEGVSMLCPVHFRHTEPTAVMPSFLHFPTPSEGVTLSLHFPTPSEGVGLASKILTIFKKLDTCRMNFIQLNVFENQLSIYDTVIYLARHNFCKRIIAVTYLVTRQYEILSPVCIPQQALYGNRGGRHGHSLGIHYLHRHVRDSGAQL